MTTSSHEKLSSNKNAWGVQCPGCGSFTVRIKEVEENQSCGFGDPTDLQVQVPVYACDACCFCFTDGTAEAIIETERRERIRNLLSPEAIKTIRTKLGLSQTEFAELTGFGTATLKRWESGGRRQNVSADNFLRLLGDDPTLLKKLRHLLRIRKS